MKIKIHPLILMVLIILTSVLLMAFQIVDDLLDYGGTKATGKNVGDDFRERKLTLPVIRAVAMADAVEREFWVRTIQKGKQADGDLDVEEVQLPEADALRE